MAGTRWTQHAVAYVIGGSALVAAGAIVAREGLTLLGGVLLLLVAIDALRLHIRPPKLDIDVGPRRVQEEGMVTVAMKGHRVHADHQMQVELSPGLHLASGTNVWHPTGEDTFEFAVRAKTRGPQEVGPVCVRNWSSVRLWARDEDVIEPSTVDVIPRMEDPEGIGILSRVVKPMQGRFMVNRPGQGFDFFTLRQYQSGDTIRDVNWKASARKDEDLIVNQRQLETHSELLILLDARVVSGVGPISTTPLDRSCRVALGLYAEAVSSRDIVRFVAYGNGLERLPPGTSDRVRSFENLLARLPAAGATGAVEAWNDIKNDMKSRGPIFVLTSAEADESLVPAVADMVGRGHPVTVLSPEPMGADWDAQEARQRYRTKILDGARDRGAMVVDWRPGAPVLAEKPSTGVFA